MHDEAYAYVRDISNQLELSGEVFEIGGFNVNGGVRGLIPHTRWVSVDIKAGPDVDIVADAADLRLGETFDVVVCTEVFEHTPKSPDIIVTAFEHLRPGGVFISTMAGPGRQVHGADGGRLQPDEFYANVEAETLTGWLTDAGFVDVSISDTHVDMRCWARSPIPEGEVSDG